jgi:hypothetical protein
VSIKGGRTSSPDHRSQDDRDNDHVVGVTEDRDEVGHKIER